jgi:serine/threonine-protein kinase
MLDAGDIVDGKYEVVGILGKGGMGTVYEGRNLRIRRRVAIKILHPAVAANPDMVKRFEREATAAARIGNNHIVDVLDLGDLADGGRYIVMEFLDGENLAARFKRLTRVPPEHLLPIVVQALDGLEAAHNAGIIHRDLKPDNVYLVPDPGTEMEFVKLLDFGVSKFLELDAPEGQLTNAGTLVGTPHYMSPEQARGKQHIDHRTDIYAIGVMMYRGLSGNVPFEGESFNDLLFRIALEEARPLEHAVPDLDPHLVAVVKRAMARDANHRYPTARDLGQALEQWLLSRGISIRQFHPLNTGRFRAAGGNPTPTPSGAPMVSPMPMATSNSFPVTTNPTPTSGVHPGYGPSPQTTPSFVEAPTAHALRQTSSPTVGGIETPHTYTSRNKAIGVGMVFAVIMFGVAAASWFRYGRAIAESAPVDDVSPAPAASGNANVSDTIDEVPTTTPEPTAQTEEPEPSTTTPPEPRAKTPPRPGTYPVQKKAPPPAPNPEPSAAPKSSGREFTRDL